MRRKQATQTAFHVTTARTVELLDGRSAYLQPGDWLITRGKENIDSCPSASFADRYERVTEDLQVPPALRRRLEATTGIGTTRTAEDLVEGVERLARISIGSIVIDFTPGQLEEIKYRAVKRGHTVEQELRAAIERIKDEIFWRG